MNNLEKWVYGLPKLDIASYELLKQEVYEHAKRDYVFFPFLIGHVESFIEEDGITENIRNCLFQLLYDLIIENKVVVFFVTKTDLKAAHWKNKKDVEQIIEEVKTQWNSLDNENPEMNEVIWLTTLNDLEIKDIEEKTRIKFSNFKNQSGNNPVFIDLLVEITMDSAIAKEIITIELSDLDEFARNLKRLNETLSQIFYFQHIDEQLQIKFEPQITGIINVTGFLRDKQYINTLNFSFEMHSAKLLSIIRQTENIVDVIR